ncbi:hypothetical protein HZS_2048, partial [Henneguya salminicola]
ISIKPIFDTYNNKDSTYFVYFFGISFGVILIILFILFLSPLRIYRDERFLRFFPLNMIISLREKLFSVFSKNKKTRNTLEVSETTKLNSFPVCCDTLGIGDTWLNNTRISNQIDFGELIGIGRFSQVFHGTWNCQAIAIKILFPNSEDSGQYESYIYQNFNLRHENILCKIYLYIVGFIAMDKIFKNEWLQTWLIFDYHSRGSLHNYLSHNEISSEELKKIVISIGSGLCYLHLEIIGVEHRKPSMAHRDLKGSNVLVKNDGNCCICDLGTVLIDQKYTNLIQDSLSGDTDTKIPIDSREAHMEVIENSVVELKHVGTKRYLPPEALSNTMLDRRFEVIQKGDVYAFGLLLWEICRRTNFNQKAKEYKLAFEYEIPDDPTIEDMHNLI